MLQAKPMSEAYQETLQAVYTTLKKETKRTGKLSGIKNIIRSDRSHNKPHATPPVLWIFPSTMECLDKFSLIETWKLPLILIMITKSKDADRGHLRSSELLNQARHVLLHSQRLGIPTTIQSITSTIVDPYPEIEEDYDSTLHPTMAVLDITFRSQELDNNPTGP